MIRPVAVEPRAGYRIWLRYEDGTAGEVDLSHLAGRGVFAAWDEPGCFERVHIAPHRAIAWNSDLELCADALYQELTGISLEADDAAFAQNLDEAMASERVSEQEIQALLQTSGRK